MLRGWASVLKTVLLEVDAVGVGEEKVEVLEGFGEEEAFHVVALGFGFDVGEGGEGGRGAAVLDDGVVEGEAHLRGIWGRG